MHGLCAEVAAREAAGCSRSEILQAIQPAREAQAQAPFVRRMQEWPRGYPGDFETVDYIVHQRSRALPGTVAEIVEQYALSSAIAQQHRNKLAFQARLISAHALAAMHDRREARILSIACGGSHDAVQCLDVLALANVRLVLTDMDPDALSFSRQALQGALGGRIVTVEGNILRRLGELSSHGPYDLVIAGGLFDYLSDRHVSVIVRQVFERLLRAGGRFAFTNIAPDNPFRHWIEYFGDWHLIGRSERDLEELVKRSAVADVELALSRDGTGLAVLVEAVKRG